MRVFNFYKPIYEGASRNYREFVYEITDRLNSEEERIESAKKTNIEFFEKVKEITDNPDNALYAARMIVDLMNKTPRLSYIKEAKLDDKTYDIEIDSLMMTFETIEV